jgi:hypothetical protein
MQGLLGLWLGLMLAIAEARAGGAGRLESALK